MKGGGLGWREEHLEIGWTNVCAYPLVATYPLPATYPLVDTYPLAAACDPFQYSYLCFKCGVSAVRGVLGTRNLVVSDLEYVLTLPQERGDVRAPARHCT